MNFMAHSRGLSLASIRPSLYRAVRVVIAIITWRGITFQFLITKNLTERNLSKKYILNYGRIRKICSIRFFDSKVAWQWNNVPNSRCFQRMYPPSDIQVTNIVTRFLNSNHLPNLQMLFTVTLIIINSIYEGGIYLEIFRMSSIHWDVSQTQVVTIIRARAKQEEPYLEYHSRHWWRYSQHFSTHIWVSGALYPGF